MSICNYNILKSSQVFNKEDLRILIETSASRATNRTKPRAELRLELIEALDDGKHTLMCYTFAFLKLKIYACLDIFLTRLYF